MTSQRCDAILVLGCRISETGEVRGAARRRVAAAARAYARGDATWVVVSGGRRWGSVTEAAAMARELRAAGVPDEAISLEPRSRTTFENARCAAPLLRSRGATRVAVVTCDWHMPRASALVAREGFEVVEVPAPSPSAPGRTTVYRCVREAIAKMLDVVQARHRALDVRRRVLAIVSSGAVGERVGERGDASRVAGDARRRDS